MEGSPSQVPDNTTCQTQSCSASDSETCSSNKNTSSTYRLQPSLQYVLSIHPNRFWSSAGVAFLNRNIHTPHNKSANNPPTWNLNSSQIAVISISKQPKTSPLPYHWPQIKLPQALYTTTIIRCTNHANNSNPTESYKFWNWIQLLLCSKFTNQ